MSDFDFNNINDLKTEEKRLYEEYKAKLAEIKKVQKEKEAVGQVFTKGLLPIYVLHILKSGPTNGNEISTKISERTNGLCDIVERKLKFGKYGWMSVIIKKEQNTEIDTYYLSITASKPFQMRDIPAIICFFFHKITLIVKFNPRLFLHFYLPYQRDYMEMHPLIHFANYHITLYVHNFRNQYR